VSTYRQIRRQARRARRAGLQPIVVIDRALPGLAWVLLARLAWRYRSEIAPAVTAGAVLAAGWWLHAAYPGWWPFLLIISDLAAFALAMFGGHIRLTRLAERVYAAAAALAIGGWLAIAMILGPLTSPMLPVLLFGAVIFAVPWWANRRRRARARVQRAFAAWPDIARAIGLPEAKIQSARVDLWGWRASVKLAFGQTIADLTARIPAIESALGTYRGAVSVYSAGDGKADWCELCVLDTKRHAGAIPWPGPSAWSIAEPVNLGPSEDAGPCLVSFLRRHTLLADAAGSGESNGLSVIMAALAACHDVVI
jgi:S-DNA-T family DNA segregation ATPase FtsK/SpoIIIE